MMFWYNPDVALEPKYPVMPLPLFVSWEPRIDGIIYASAVALGFASFENLEYLSYMSGLELFGRAISTPLTHTIFSSIWGYSIGQAKIKHKPLLKPAFIGLLLASIIHGIFNYFTFTPSLRIISALVILIIWVWRIRLIEKISGE